MTDEEVEVVARPLSESLLASCRKISNALCEYETPATPIDLNAVLADLAIAGQVIKKLCDALDSHRQKAEGK